MKIGIFARDNYRNTGIETFESNVIPYLLEEIEDSEAIRFEPRENYPLSRTIERATMGRRMKKRMERGNFDKLFIPAQDRIQFDPSSVDTTVIPYVHDIMPVTTMFKKHQNSTRGKVSGYLSTLLAVRYMKFLVKCDEVICSTRHVKKELENRTAFDGKAHVIYQGVDDKDSGDYEGDRDIDLLYVGGLIERKNPELLEKSLTQAQEAGYTVATVNYEETGLPGRSYVDVTDEELANLYARSRYYIHPSLAEGFGRGPVEAQKNGCIPLALDTRVNNEVLGSGFYKIKDSDDVERIISTEVGEDMRKQARENSERFKWEDTRKKIREVLEK